MDARTRGTMVHAVRRRVATMTASSGAPHANFVSSFPTIYTALCHCHEYGVYILDFSALHHRNTVAALLPSSPHLYSLLPSSIS
ncbi:hypothetical protein EON65_49640 [archaeon]|nr:MAG: hypothetical protein EON65_49640 [archaeon]